MRPPTPIAHRADPHNPLDVLAAQIRTLDHRLTALSHTLEQHHRIHRWTLRALITATVIGFAGWATAITALLRP